MTRFPVVVRAPRSLPNCNCLTLVCRQDLHGRAQSGAHELRPPPPVRVYLLLCARVCPTGVGAGAQVTQLTEFLARCALPHLAGAFRDAGARELRGLRSLAGPWLTAREFLDEFRIASVGERTLLVDTLARHPTAVVRARPWLPPPVPVGDRAGARDGQAAFALVRTRERAAAIFSTAFAGASDGEAAAFSAAVRLDAASVAALRAHCAGSATAAAAVAGAAAVGWPSLDVAPPADPGGAPEGALLAVVGPACKGVCARGGRGGGACIAVAQSRRRLPRS